MRNTMRSAKCEVGAMVGWAAFAICVAVGLVSGWAEDRVTEGCLQAMDREHNPVGYCPLKHTDVDVAISGFIARVTVKQTFGNPYKDPIEAVYTFPLSDRGAVDAMTMTIGDRVIKGAIKKREEARRIYEEARNAGKAASLLDQERPNIFTQSVANILPGSDILITISYVEYLKYEDNQYEYSFPMVVGPRYIPGQPKGAVEFRDGGRQPVIRGGTDQVPDSGRITPPVTPEGKRAGHDVSLTVRLDAAIPIQDIKSDLHEVDVERPSESQAVVKLKNRREIPNRDFVLRYRVAGKALADAVLTHADAKGGFFTLILQPPDRVAPDQITPKEMLFVIDCSGSMSGFPIEKAKKTMKQCIEQMNPDDTFNLVSFSGGTGYCFSGPVPNTRENCHTALDYLGGLHGGGGTEMMTAIQAALANQNDSKRLRVVCFMTDGFIGNDMAILDAIQKHAKTARVFSFGIGNGVNRFLIEGMARAGRGAAEVVSLESDADAAAKRFHERIHSPLLTDISVDFGGLPISDVYPDPEAIPDLFSSQPLVLKGRYTGSADGTITVHGKTAAGPFERKIRVTLPQDDAEHDVLAPLWARARIDWLMEQDWAGMQQGSPDAKLKDEIAQLGLDFSLVTQFTSFVAVEEKVINEGGKTQKVEVPVEMTDGVSYEGVYGPGQDVNGSAQGAKMLKSSVGGNMAAAVASAPPPAPAMMSFDAVRRPARHVASEMPVREELAKPEAKPEPKAEPDAKRVSVPGKGHSKIDAALQGLAEKLSGGSFEQGAVKVQDGWVQVFIELTDDSPERLEALKALGVKIVSHRSSGKAVLAKVQVGDLEKVAELDYVKSIKPPRF